MNIDLLQSAASGVYETMRCTSFDHQDLTGGRFSDLVANNEARLALLD